MFLGFINNSLSNQALPGPFNSFEKHVTPGHVSTGFISRNSEITFTCWSPVDQPKTFTSADTEDAILMLIGNIYHYASLTNPSTDQLLKEYRTNGISFLNSCNGEFCGILYDKKTKEVFAFKDHVGTIPLTLAQNHQGVFFSSETNLLIKYVDPDEPLNDEYVVSRFYGFASNYAIQAKDSILRVLGGSYVNIVRFKNERYWHLDHIKINKGIERETVLKELNELVDLAIQDRLKDNRKIGVHISGGLDSALVAGKLKDRTPSGNLFGYSWSPEGEIETVKKETLTYDERKVLRKFSDKLGIPIRYTPFDQRDFESYMLDWQNPQDFPFERNLLSNAKEDKTEQIFTGFGGDEFIAPDKMAFLSNLLRKGKFQAFLKYNSNKSVIGRIKFIINEGVMPLRRKPMLTKKVSFKILKYFKKGWNNRNHELYSNLCKSPQDYMVSVLNYHHIESRCEQWYCVGSGYGIQYSHPLIDKRIIEYCYALPMSIFYEGNTEKILIRSLAKPFATDEMLKLKRTQDPALFANYRKMEEDSVPFLIDEFNILVRSVRFTFLEQEKIIGDIKNIDKLNSQNKEQLVYTLTYYVSVGHLIKELTGNTYT